MNKLTLILILIVSTILSGCGSLNDKSPKRVIIQLGMDNAIVLEKLESLGARDIGNGMQVMEREPEKLKNWMWHLKEYNLTLETIYSDGKLITLNYWDWTNRALTSYHHTMEYHELSELTLDTETNQSFTKLIKKHNQK